eukprot:5257927-Pyramimonas_sp.AAC.1
MSKSLDRQVAIPMIRQSRTRPPYHPKGGPTGGHGACCGARCSGMAEQQHCVRLALVPSPSETPQAAREVYAAFSV